MKIKIWVNTCYIGSIDEREIDVEDDLGIDIEDWKDFQESDKDECIFDYIQDEQMFETGWEEIE